MLSPGADPGDWSSFGGQVDTKNRNNTCQVTPKDDAYLIVSPHQKSGLGAIHKDGIFNVKGAVLPANLTYLERTDGNVGPELFADPKHKRQG